MIGLGQFISFVVWVRAAWSRFGHLRANIRCTGPGGIGAFLHGRFLKVLRSQGVGRFLPLAGYSGVGRKVGSVKVGQMEENSVIGYFLAEGDVVLGPPGKTYDVLFGSRARAEAAAAAWGLVAGRYGVHALYYQGLLGMTLHDTGDVLMDGMAVRRLMESCQRERRLIHRDAMGRVDITEQRCIYSSRLLLLGVSELRQMTD